MIPAPCIAAPCIVALSLAVMPALAAKAETGWSGSLGLAAVTQDDGGSEDSFRTQTQLQEGFLLEDLTLLHKGEDGSRFDLRASGFGDAEPDWHARLDWHSGVGGVPGAWRLGLRYDRRESFFRLTTTELGQRSDDWAIDRWTGTLDWDGWKAATLGLDLRYHQRTGTVSRPLFGLNAIFPLAVDLDETFQEATFRLQTKELPVSILFEQSLATYERQNRRSASDDPRILRADETDLFVAALDTRDEKRDVPTSRLLVTWGNPRVEVAGSVLWSPADLDGPGTVSEAFDIDGGRVGRVEFIDDVMASANLDTLAGNVRLGFVVAPRWTLRLEGDVRDRSTDATLLGQRLVRVTDPRGNVFDLPALIDESTFLDVTDQSERLTVEWRDHGWTVWAGGSIAQRDVSWRRGTEDSVFDQTRDGDGLLAGASWTRGPVTGQVELEHGTFEDFVFRTDPETVDRLTFRLRSSLAGGWEISARGRFEEADNPVAESGLDHSSDSLGVGLGWTSKDGVSGIGLDLDRVDLTTETDLVLPDGGADLSRYDLGLLTLGLHGRTELGKLRLSGSVARIDDDGETWPVESWIARARLGFDIASRTELAVFGELWSYDEKRAEADDYDVTRVGLALRWRFE